MMKIADYKVGFIIILIQILNTYTTRSNLNLVFTEPALPRFCSGPALPLSYRTSEPDHRNNYLHYFRIDLYIIFMPQTFA